MRASEYALESCRAISWFIAKHRGAGWSEAAIREGLLLDLLWKAKDLDATTRGAVMVPSLISNIDSRILPASPGWRDQLAILPPLASESLDRTYDVGIVTILGPELDATLLSLGIELKRETVHFGLPVWFGEITRPDKRPLSVVVGRVQKGRNVPMAIYVSHLRSHFKTPLIIVVGIAAGPIAKVKLGDAVVSLGVYDYEHVRSELGSEGQIIEKPRPWWREIDKELLPDVNEFRDHHVAAFQELYDALMLEALGRQMITDLHQTGRRLHAGTVAAGERLFADGALQAMYDKVDEEIRAGDQEDSGLAQACVFFETRWLAFRGIADYGDPDKDKTWHFEASVAAAAAAVTFLKRAYRAPGDDTF